MGQTSDQAPDAARDEVVVETLGDDLFIERADDDIISEDELPSVDVIPINPPAGAAERKSIVADLLEKSIAEDSVIKRLPPALAPLTLDAPKETDAPQPSDPTRGKLKKKLFLLSIAGIVGLTLVLGVILALIFFK